MHLRVRNRGTRKKKGKHRKIKIKRKSRRIVGNLLKETSFVRPLRKRIRRSLSKSDIKTRTSHTVYSMGGKLLNRIIEIQYTREAPDREN